MPLILYGNCSSFNLKHYSSWWVGLPGCTVFPMYHQEQPSLWAATLHHGIPKAVTETWNSFQKGLLQKFQLEVFSVSNKKALVSSADRFQTCCGPCGEISLRLSLCCQAAAQPRLPVLPLCLSDWLAGVLQKGAWLDLGTPWETPEMWFW